MKIDLHCHSKWSKRPTLWIMQKLGCPESFTEPRELYRLAREKGMDWVTITDHNVIDASLEIADLPNTFMGCEYTTYFPEDQCKVHILVYGQTEAQHADITRARENIFDLVRYLDEQNLRTICAHPLFWINDRLTIAHIEQLLLLFKNWEVNGDISPAMNDATREIVDRLTPEFMEDLANKHGFEPHYPMPWVKNLTCGSDDHSSLNLAESYTEVEDAETLDGFWEGLHASQAKIVCQQSNPKLFARNIYGIAYQFYKTKIGLGRYANKDVFLKFLDESLQTRPKEPKQSPSWYHLMRVKRRASKPRSFRDHSLFQMARFEAERHILDDPRLMSIVQEGRGSGAELDQQWYDFVNQVSNKVSAEFGEHLVDRVAEGRLFDLFHSMGTAGSLYALLAPYFFGYSLHRSERDWSEKVLGELFGEEGDRARKKPRFAHFSDTYYEVNGVARTLQEHLALAQKFGKHYSVITCDPSKGAREAGLYKFSPVGQWEVPEYPEVKMLLPPFMKMLQHCYEKGYTHFHAATPGPVGLAALSIARILRVPISGTYHTAFPQFAKAMTGDSYLEEVLWRLMIWFYDNMDTVYVPSEATGVELVEKGLSEKKIRLYPRGCDIERYHPRNRCDILHETYQVPKDDKVNFVYVGRVSREKSLDVLAEAFRQIVKDGVNARLLIVGEGPYLAELRTLLAETDSVFTGYVEGQKLAEVYASSDCLVFPSTTDTFGKVVLEAQASGIPAIVTDHGGPAENIVRGETGLSFQGKDVQGLADALAEMAGDKAVMRRMGEAGRRYMDGRGSTQAFLDTYAMYTEQEAAPGERPESLESALSEKLLTHGVQQSLAG